MESVLIVLRKAFRHKLWMYDVVSSLIGLHHMEAAVATTVERPSKQRLDLGGYYVKDRRKAYYCPAYYFFYVVRSKQICTRDPDCC